LAGPRDRRAAKQRDELAAVHSITSVRASSVIGTSRPIALAAFQVDHRFEFVRRLHRQVGRRLAPEDASDVAAGPPKLIDLIRPVGDEPAGSPRSL
jgi:hypothetical protein